MLFRGSLSSVFQAHGCEDVSMDSCRAGGDAAAGVLAMLWSCAEGIFELPWEEKQETGSPPCKQINGTRSGDVRRRKLCIACVSVHSFIRCQRTELGKAFIFGFLTQGRTDSQFPKSPC